MRSRNEDGSAIVEFVWLGILLLMPLLYVVIGVFDTQRTAYAASTAARAAGRAFVTAPDQQTGYTRATTAARLAFEDQGIDAPDGFSLSITCMPRPRDCLTPGSVVAADVHATVSLTLLHIPVEATHQAPYGTFRESRP